MLIRSRALLLSATTVMSVGTLVDNTWSQTKSPICREVEAQPTPEPALEVGNVLPADNTAGGLDLIDDIWNLVNNTWTLLNSVSTRVNTAITRATEGRDRAIEAGERALEARDHAADMVGNMNDGVQNLTAEMRGRIQAAVAELEQALQHELAGAEAFMDGPNSCGPICEEFRADLVLLLTSLEDVSNALLSLSAFNGQTDFSEEIAFVESLPGNVLFPLYRAFQALPILNEEFLTELSQTAANLQDVAPFIGQPVVAGGGGLITCELLLENKELLNKMINAAEGIEKIGKILKGAGGLIKAIGKSKIGTRVGIWGWAGVSYSSGLLEKIGELIGSVADRLTPVADKVEKKVQYCVLTTNQEDILAMVETNRQEILDAIKTIPRGNGPDLNGDGTVNLQDYSSFQNAFGSTAE